MPLPLRMGRVGCRGSLSVTYTLLALLKMREGAQPSLLPTQVPWEKRVGQAAPGALLEKAGGEGQQSYSSPCSERGLGQICPPPPPQSSLSLRKGASPIFSLLLSFQLRKL